MSDKCDLRLGDLVRAEVPFRAEFESDAMAMTRAVMYGRVVNLRLAPGARAGAIVAVEPSTEDPRNSHIDFVIGFSQPGNMPNYTVSIAAVAKDEEGAK